MFDSVIERGESARKRRRAWRVTLLIWFGAVIVYAGLVGLGQAPGPDWLVQLLP